MDAIHDAIQCTLYQHDASDGGRDVDEDAVASEDCVTGTERSAACGSVKLFIDSAIHF